MSIDFAHGFTELYLQIPARSYSLSRLEVLRTLQIKIAQKTLLKASSLAAIESIFHTIASPVFSELEFIIWFSQGTKADHFPEDFFDTLYRMYRAKPFKLAFLFIVWANSEVWGEGWRGWVNTAVNEGPLSCLESPPSVRFSWDGVYEPYLG